jgi:membrane protease YdiL (CAAX protease family)
MWGPFGMSEQSMAGRLGRAAGFGLLTVAGGLIGTLLASDEGLSFAGEAPLFTALFAVGFVVAFAASFFIKPSSREVQEAPTMGPAGFVMAALASSVFMGAIAFAIGKVLGYDLLEQLQPSGRGLVLGLLLPVPMILMLMAIMAVPLGFLRRFRDQQIADFVKMGVDFGWVPIILISIGAGFGEELLFRGVLQNWLTEVTGPLVGIGAASLVFGIVHGPRLGYIVVSALIGVYLGTAYVLTGSLLAVALAHFLYDVFALRITVIEVRKAKRERAVTT